MLMGLRRLSAGTWRIRNGGWEDEIVRNLRRQRHLDGRRQTIRLQNDSADCSIYFNYGRGMAVGDFSAPLRFARNDGEGGGLGGPLSAFGFRLPAAGCWLSAFSFWLSAIGVPSAIPPSPLRGPLPPDKQWGAREYIGARYMAPFGGRSNGVRTLAKKRAFPFEVAKGLPPFERKQTQSSPAGGYVPCPQKKDRRSGLFSYQHSRSSSTGQWSLPRISEWMEAPLIWSFHTLETRK